MGITIDELQKYINALRKCAKEHESDRTSTGHIIVSDLCRDTANLLEQLEQEPTTKNDLITLTFSKGTLKYSCKDYVVYKRDWFRSHYRAEIDIMFGDSQYKEPTAKNDLGVDWDELKRKIFMEVDGGTDDRWLSYADVCDNISDSIDDFKANMPSVTPQESMTGHWINKYHSFESCSAECSSCHKRSNGYVFDNGFSLERKYYDFCPNCGAKMVEPRK